MTKQLNIAALAARIAALPSDWQRTVLLAAAVGDDGYGLDMAWAEHVVTPPFLRRLLELHELVHQHGLEEVHVNARPRRWELNESAIELRDPLLVVRALGFSFQAHTEHERWFLATSYLGTEDLIARVLADPGTEPVVSFLTVFNSTEAPEILVARYLATTA